MENDFIKLYDSQINFQNEVYKLEHNTEIVLPQDCLDLFQYHTLAILEELGEVLKADKRWKTHRNQRYIYEEKKDEIADVFITVMNIAIYSGMSADDLLSEVKRKMEENVRRLEQEKCQ